MTLTGESHQICLPAFALPKLLQVAGDRGVRVAQPEGGAVHVAARGEGDRHHVALDFHVRWAVSQDNAHAITFPNKINGHTVNNRRTVLKQDRLPSQATPATNVNNQWQPCVVQAMPQRPLAKNNPFTDNPPPASSPPNPSTQSRSPSSSPNAKGRAAALFGSRSRRSRHNTGNQQQKGSAPVTGCSFRSEVGRPAGLWRTESSASGCGLRVKDARTQRVLMKRTGAQAGGKPAPLSNRTHSDDRPATPTSRLGAGRGENG